MQCNHFSAFPKSSRVRPPYWIHGRCLAIASRAQNFERRLANGLFYSELSKLITVPDWYISYVRKHMKWSFSYVWNFSFSKHMSYMLAKFICLQTYETPISYIRDFFIFKTYELYVRKIDMFTNRWNGHFHMSEIRPKPVTNIWKTYR